MLETPVSRLIPKMAMPTIVAFLINSIYNLADTFFVSQLGTYATGAVGVNSAIDQIILMAGSLFSMGAASYLSRLLGAKEDKHAERVLSMSFFFVLFLGLAVLVVGNIWQDPILRLLGATDKLMPYSKQYCRYVLLAAPIMASSLTLNQCLRAEGSALLSMVGMGFGGILNVALDPIFIFRFGGGVAGASAATAISKLVSWCILITPYLRKKTLLALKLRNFRLNAKDFGEVCSMGSASFFRTGLATLASVVMTRVAVFYGESALAAVSVANRITMILTSICLGYGQGYQPVAGYSWGAKSFKRIREAYRFASLSCMAGISVIALVMGLAARPILLLFTEDDAELVRIGVICLRVQLLAMPIHAYAIIVNMLCMGIGNARGAVLLGLSRQGICFYPPLVVLVWLFGVWGVAAAQGVADILSLALALPILRKAMKCVSEAEKRYLTEKSPDGALTEQGENAPAADA